MNRCGICNRLMTPWRWPWRLLFIPWENRMDCGGDCFRCVDEAERAAHAAILRRSEGP